MGELLKDILDLERLEDNAVVLSYINHLAEQQLDSLRSSESHTLAQSYQSLLLSLQKIAKRSCKQVVDSAAKHEALQFFLPLFISRAQQLHDAIPILDSHAEQFSISFSRVTEGGIVARRKRALQLFQNSQRLVDVLELPPLFEPASRTTTSGHSSPLELYAHVRRLASLYPYSALISSVLSETDIAVREMTSSMIDALRSPNLKLTTAVRTVGWLKRLIPDILSDAAVEDILPALFLVCRLVNFVVTLGALYPLQRLADEERLNRGSSQSWSGGKQTERYLKRFIEVFREHSFNMVSVCRSVSTSFTSSRLPGDELSGPLPPILSTFPLHLVRMLLDTLLIYLPTVRDEASRDSILTQVLYCAGSLGRLGADFGMLLGLVGVNNWVDVVRSQRL